MVARQAPSEASPRFDRRPPLLVVLVDACRTDHDDVKVAGDPGFAPSERSEDDHACWRRHHLLGRLCQFGDGGVADRGLRERRNRDATFSSTKWNSADGGASRRSTIPRAVSVGGTRGCLGGADVGEAGDRPEVQLRRGLGEDSQNASLHAGYHCLHRLDEIHS